MMLRLLAIVICLTPLAAQAEELDFDVRNDVTYSKVGDHELLLDAFVPTKDGTYPAVLVVHGGGWRMGDRKQLRGYARSLTRLGCVCFAIDYRLAPKHKFPAQIEDCRAAVRWIREHAGEYNVNANKLGAIGYSAGGHLVSLLATTGEAPSEANGNVDTRVQAVAAGGAPTEFRYLPDKGEWAKYWMGGTLETVPNKFRDASPTAFVDKDDAPVFFFNGTADKLVPIIWSQALHGALKKTGVRTELHTIQDAGHLQAAGNAEALDKAYRFLMSELTEQRVEKAAEVESSIGRKIADFSLRDCFGKERSLDEFKRVKLVVVAFLGTECPLARLYGARLESLNQQFADQGVSFIGINSNTQDSITELANYRQQHGITFPLLKDLGNKVADKFKAIRTPEVFVLDQDRNIRYYGRIDDQYAIGVQREKPKTQDLAVALTELLAGKEISVPVTEAVGCYLGRVQSVEPHGEITYAKHIAPIFNRRCVECHRDGEIAPFPLSDYSDVEGWGDTIAEVIRDGRMPPWNANPAYGHFKNDARLSDREKQLVYQWIDNGMPAGDPSDLPTPPQFVEGWRIAEPDQIITMREEPFDVPAEGVVDYQYFTVDPEFKEDKFVVAAECRPGNRAVVHHIIAYIWPPGETDFHNSGAVDGYSPGSSPTVHQDGQATLVPAGSKLVFEVHYTPNGSAQQDLSCVGLKFTTKAKVVKLIKSDMAINGSFAIPPGDANHLVTARKRIRDDVLLVNLTPHMHLRGKSFRYEAEYPNGNREILLDVPRYDFNWQLTYDLAKPLLLPKDTLIHCTAYFDNSENNPANPDPSKKVRWGDQSWEEMMIGFFDVMPADERDVHAFWESREKPATAKTIDPSGVWRWEHNRGSKTVKNVLTVQYDGKAVTGTYQGDGKQYEIQKAGITGNALSFEFPVDIPGQKITVAFAGKITDDEIEGTVSFVSGEGAFDLPWRAERD